ncbi:MAG TPA: GNAT family N-acetyltransferase [Myxococcales bacterium]|jgi:phosphinothricin acetyltransferase
MIVRDATEIDLPGILAIYNDVIARSTAVWTEEPSTLDDRRNWLSARKASGYPVLVAASGSAILGFASFGDFRAWPGYRHTVEHSIHVRSEDRRHGVGSALLPQLLERARALDKHVLLAGIDGENEASIAFHRRFGFTDAGRLREVGRKFGRWIDLVFLQLAL